MADITIEIAGTEFQLDFSVKITSRGYPAKLSGPPEDCYPAEDAEFEVTDLVLRPLTIAPATGVPGELGYRASRWVAGDPLDVPAWLLPILETVAQESDDAAEVAGEQSDNWGRRDPDDSE